MPPSLSLPRLELKATNATPAILLDPASGHLSITGDSYPENVAAFFMPVLEALRQTLEVVPKLTVDFRLTYFNTSSAKLFYDLFVLLEEASQTTELEINWHYQANDEMMLEHGEDYQLDFKLPIKLCEIP